MSCLCARARAASPPHVRFVLGDAADLVATLGKFNLIFADAPGGKLFKLRRTVDALAPRGVLLVDDMSLEDIFVQLVTNEEAE